MNKQAFLVFVAVALAAYEVNAVYAGTVLHDTTWMTDNQTYDDSLHSAIGASQHGLMLDNNVATNFILTGGYHITNVVADFIAPASWGGQGVLVEFFADAGGSPSNDPAAVSFVANGQGLNVSAFENHLNPALGMRFSMDLSNAAISLSEGSWWISVVPVHEGEGSQQYRWLRTKHFQEGDGIHVRGGGAAHGNGYGSNWGWDEWALYSGLGPDFLFPPGDMAVAISGVAIPAPGTIGLLALGCFGCRRRRR